jgi:diguanylate cyclase (GGDEF)-like protein
MAILDMDNFKEVNDKCGHSAGDQLLKNFGHALREYVAPVGVVGRFGGDEFIIINLKDHRLDDVKKYFNEMYESEKVVRRNYVAGDTVFNITATVGSSTHSRDSRDFDVLFERADKALYRGKTKGRNCYVTYIHDMHKNIDIKDINKVNVHAVMDHVSSIFIANKKIEKLIEEALKIIHKELNVSLAFYVDENSRMMTSKVKGVNKLEPKTIEQVNKMFGDHKMIEFSNLSKVKGTTGKIANDLTSNNIEAILIKKVYFGENPYGFIGLLTINDNRIWQNDDKVLITFLEKLIGFARLHNID